MYQVCDFFDWEGVVVAAFALDLLELADVGSCGLAFDASVQF